MAPFLPNQFLTVGLFAESVTWGVSIVTFVLCMRALLFDKDGLKSSAKVHKLLFGVSVSMVFFSTLLLSLNLSRMVLVTSGNAAAAAKEENFGSVKAILRYLSVSGQTLIGDGMLVYRCWIVHGRSWIIGGIAAVLWLCCAASAGAIVAFVATLPGSVRKPPPQYSIVMIIFWSISISLNIYTTGMIVYRIYRDDSSIARRTINASPGARKLQKTVRIIIESGLIYTATAACTLATFTIKTAGVYVTTAIEPQVVAIVFNLIIIRIAEKRDAYHVPTNTSSISQVRTNPGRILYTKEYQVTRDDGRDYGKDYELNPMDMPLATAK